MPLHLVKLAVGCESIKDLQDRLRERLRQAKEQGQAGRRINVVTRMTPKRDAELLDGGSLFWVVKGQIAARQRLFGLEPFRDKAGISRCRIVVDPKVIVVSPRPMRAFQGWRYLSPNDSPPDLGKAGTGLAAMPETLRRELRELGLL